MDKRILGIIIPVLVIIIASLLFISPSSENTTQKNNENIGLVINSPSSSVSLQQLDKFFTDASSTGIGRSNVYIYWNIIEPVEGKFDWSQSDIIMGLNEKKFKHAGKILARKFWQFLHRQEQTQIIYKK